MNRLFIVLCCTLLLLTGCLTTTTQSKQSDSPTLSPKKELMVSKTQMNMAFQLDVGDVIAVKVHGENELDSTYQIYPECTIQFPMIHTVKVCGRTPGQIQQEIATRLHKDYFKQLPAVVVKVKEFNSKKIHVFGQVAKPGRFDYVKGLTLLQAIAMAGGFTRRAARNDTRLIRTVGGSKRIYRISLRSLGKRRLRDLYVRPGDIIYIPESWI